MPDHCKIAGDVVGSYRKYYILEKRRFESGKNMVQLCLNGTEKVSLEHDKRTNTEQG